jgi:CRP/FNR family transcriptional regulator, cyclic AMP receptor protein
VADFSDTGIAASNAIFSRGGILFGLNPSILARDCSAAKIRSLSNGASIYNQGSRCGFVYCVLQGQVKLARVSQDGDELTTSMLSAGELFGPALGRADSAEAKETAMGRGPTSVWQVPALQFRKLLLKQPEIALHVIGALSRRQQQMERRLECFAFKRAEARLAETLRELSGGFEMRCEHGFGRHIRLTQQELADLVGASRPVVSTILNRLRKTGVLGYNREYLCVRGISDIERLIDC